jgi:hypothetical protein
MNVRAARNTCRWAILVVEQRYVNLSNAAKRCVRVDEMRGVATRKKEVYILVHDRLSMATTTQFASLTHRDRNDYAAN